MNKCNQNNLFYNNVKSQQSWQQLMNVITSRKTHAVYLIKHSEEKSKESVAYITDKEILEEVAHTKNTADILLKGVYDYINNYVR